MGTAYGLGGRGSTGDDGASDLDRLFGRRGSAGITYDEGLVGLGFVQRVARANLDAHEESVRKRGLPNYTVEREGSPDPLYVVTFIEPLNVHMGALGIDIANGTNRRAAAELAMKKNRVAMSRRIALIVGDSAQPGFLLFHPVYRREASVGRSKNARRRYVVRCMRRYNRMHCSSLWRRSIEGRWSFGFMKGGGWIRLDCCGIHGIWKRREAFPRRRGWSER
ncbi:MAG: CHASE domain-containing protein [Candidatus Synoicihabitans palmerolidicus]|nr:CHASE domain-containing protein [Candidatus Synoicihabitans palmerolidicus]